MNIKNIILFSFISIAHWNIHTMENSCSNSDEAASKMVLTEQFQFFEQARELHYKFDTPDTKIILNDALDQLLTTNETKVLLKLLRQELGLPSETEDNQQLQETTKKQSNNQIAQMFSKNVLKKYQTLTKTSCYQEYKIQMIYCSKAYGALNAINGCLNDILKTKEWEAFFSAMHQEKDAVNNIILSAEGIAKQTYSTFPFLKSIENNKLLQINLFGFLFYALDMQLSFTQNQ